MLESSKSGPVISDHIHRLCINVCSGVECTFLIVLFVYTNFRWFLLGVNLFKIFQCPSILDFGPYLT